MLKSYLLIAWRNIAKNNAYSLINIGGLGVGMAIGILIGLWIYDELSFNKGHKNYDNIVQVLQHQHISNSMETYAALPLPVVKELRDKYSSDFKQVAAAVTFEQFVSSGKKVFTRTGTFAEAGLPEILTLDMLVGKQNSINDPSSVLLSESLAKTMFGSEDPLNKTVKINNAFTQQVTGVYKDLPVNSRFHDVKFIAPLSVRIKNGMADDNWSSSSFEIYALLSERSEFQKTSSKIKNILYDNTRDASVPVLFLNPMSKWHLYEFQNGKQIGTRIQFVWLFGLIGIFVLVLACINFINLCTARSAKRAKEVGIRKTVGSLRSQLIYQFFLESFLVVLCSFMLALLFVALTLSWFSQLADKQLAMPFQNTGFWLVSVAFILFTVLLSGGYPALYLSSFHPVKVLKGSFRSGRLAATPRKFLVVMQFTVSITLIIGTILVFRQIQFAKERPVGYDRNDLLTIPLNNPEIFDNYEPFKNELLASKVVEAISRSSSTTTDISSSANNLDWRGKNPDIQVEFGTILIDPEYNDVVKWKIVAGRNFSSKHATDSFAFIFNEAAINMMGLQNPIGEKVKWHGKDWHIIGVVQDMVMRSPFEKTKPAVFLMNDKERFFNALHVKLTAGMPVGMTINRIESIFKKHCPSAPFDYQFTDKAYETKFKSEERIGKLAALFASLAILISCLGLFGLASYIAEQRTKEIGVRKVLGASVFDLWKMLSKDFVVLVIISCFIATPIAYYFLHNWLQNYEYRTEISWWIFIVTGAGALLITLLTVSFQAIKAAIVNPVKSLRTE